MPKMNYEQFKGVTENKRKDTPPSGLEPETFWLTARHSTN